MFFGVKTCGVFLFGGYCLPNSQSSFWYMKPTPGTYINDPDNAACGASILFLPVDLRSTRSLPSSPLLDSTSVAVAGLSTRPWRTTSDSSWMLESAAKHRNKKY